MRWWHVMLIAGCGHLRFDPVGDAPGPLCDPGAPFGSPLPLTGINVPGAYDATITLVPDERTAYFYSNRSGNDDIFVATRPDLDTAWTVTPLSSVNTAGSESEPTVSPDGEALVITSDRPPSTVEDLWYAPRQGGIYTVTRALDVLDSPQDDYHPAFQLDGTDFWFVSDRDGTYGVFHSIFMGAGNFMPPTRVAELDLAGSSTDAVVVSKDGLTIYVRSDRPGGSGGDDIWVARRGSTDQRFGALSPVSEVNSTELDTPNWLSPDNCRLYMSSERSDASDIYVATRIPSP